MISRPTIYNLKPLHIGIILTYKSMEAWHVIWCNKSGSNEEHSMRAACITANAQYNQSRQMSRSLSLFGPTLVPKTLMTDTDT